MKKIIYIAYQPLTPKVERDFFIEPLLQEHIPVEYWDITEIFFPKFHVHGIIERDYVRTIDSWDALRTCISREDIDTVLFIVTITYEYRVLKLMRILTQYKCTLGFFARYGMRNTSDQTIMQKVLTAIKHPRLTQYIKGILARIVKKIGYVKEYDIVFAAGNHVIAQYAHAHTTKIIPLNYIDYDDYLLGMQTNERMIQEPYCVFLDQFLGLHPDDIVVGEKAIQNLDAYYVALNNLFDHIEKTYALRIVIAAHPKAHYENNPFHHRPIFYHKTAVLTRYADCAIAHASTSIIFAVLYKKPLLLVSMQTFRKSLLRGMHMFARDLHISIHPIDTKDHVATIAIDPIDEQTYTRYVYSYHTSHASEHTLSKDIFLTYVLSHQKTTCNHT